MTQQPLCHALTTHESGRVEMAYTGAKPWHGLGNLIPAGATVDDVRRAAGMDWEIHREIVKFTAPTMCAFTGEPVLDTMTVPDRVVLYRSDTFAPLAVVSKRFKEVQPREAIEFFRDMVEAGGMELETAGTLFGGARIWAMVKTNQGFSIGDDEVQDRLLFATACDGSLATSIRNTTIRVVCKNTFNLALTGGERAITVRHTTRFDAEAVKQRLREVSESFAVYASAAEQMARVRVGARKAEDFLTALLPPPAGARPLEQTKAFTTIMRLFNGDGMGATLPSAAGTAWGLLNAVTQYVDHEARSRNAETRMDSALFGAGDALKSDAYKLAGVL